MGEANWERGVARVLQLVAVGAVILAAGATVGCQTTKGVGEDIENLGDGIEDAAEAND